jgi:hypothetical protein
MNAADTLEAMGSAANNEGAMGILKDIGSPANLLKTSMSVVPDLRPLPWLERLFTRRTFSGEEIRLGPPQYWLGRVWEVRLAAVNDIIYKVAIETSASSPADAEDLSTTVFAELEKALGTPSKPSDTIIAWDASDGNAVLQRTTVLGERRFMLFLTSSIVRQFAQ